MRKFFETSKNIIIGRTLRLNKEDSSHIIRVLRMKNNDELLICDGHGIDYICTITDISTDYFVTVAVNSKIYSENEPSTHIKLYASILKGERFDWLIQKCCEIGVHEIVPVITNRTIVKLNGKEEKKVTRWNKIAYEACKQCKRSYIPIVQMPVKFDNAITNNENKLLAYVGESTLSLREGINIINDKDINVFIGPEGGYSEKEIELAKDNNTTIVHLGKRILRAETACMAICSLILYELNDI